MEYSGWRSVWIFVFFDLPTDSPADRKAYQKFRKKLLDDGFDMMQFSVYIRYCPSEENAAVHAGRIESAIPHKGKISLLRITDKQFSRIQIFNGKTLEDPPEPTGQLEFF